MPASLAAEAPRRAVPAGNVGALLALALVFAPPESGAQEPRVDGSYRLAAGDVVIIRVFQEEDLTTETRISSDGTVVMPLLGQLKLAGMTVAAASQSLAARLRDGYLVNPQVTVSIQSHTARRFVVLGQVQKPGAYELPAEQTITLLEAIAMAGGLTKIANPGKVTVMRPRQGGAPEVFKKNVKEMSRNPSAETFRILSGDTIEVPESMF